MSNPTPLTRNVTRVFREASPEQIEAGLNWYGAAHSFAAEAAERHGLTLPTTAGVIAALSPLNSWAANKSLAERFFAAGGLTSGYLGTGLRAASRILSGEDAAVVLTGDKVSAFYSCILTRGRTDVVCVDRHAYDIALNARYVDGERPKIKGKRYEAFAEVYRRAAAALAHEVGMPLFAAEVQAITWVTWRQKFWSVGAFDGI